MATYVIDAARGLWRIDREGPQDWNNIAVERPEKVVVVATDAADKRPRRPQGKKSEGASKKSEAGRKKSATKAKE